MKKITAFDTEIYFLKRASQKTLRLRIDLRGRVCLTAPLFCSEKKALSFFKQHLDWVKQHQQDKKDVFMFQNGDVVSILGKELKIIHDPSQKTGVEIKSNCLYVGGDIDFLHRRIVNFAKKSLLQYIQEKSDQMAGVISKKINRISLKDTSSRWGSCSCNNNLNFCFKIAFAPPYVIDYLIAHEVSHLKEMNHSAAFWETVALMNVSQAEAEIWLRKNGSSLMKIK